MGPCGFTRLVYCLKAIVWNFFTYEPFGMFKLLEPGIDTARTFQAAAIIAANGAIAFILRAVNVPFAIDRLTIDSKSPRYIGLMLAFSVMVAIKAVDTAQGFARGAWQMLCRKTVSLGQPETRNRFAYWLECARINAFPQWMTQGYTLMGQIGEQEFKRRVWVSKSWLATRTAPLPPDEPIRFSRGKIQKTAITITLHRTVIDIARSMASLPSDLAAVVARMAGPSWDRKCHALTSD